MVKMKTSLKFMGQKCSFFLGVKLGRLWEKRNWDWNDKWATTNDVINCTIPVDLYLLTIWNLNGLVL